MLVKGATPANMTRQGGGGRDFVLHGDGTISPAHARHLVLGVHPSGGPRPDQLQALATADSWFMGGKNKWPLQYAAMHGDVATIERLLHEGHDPNVKMTDWFDSEPLGWAASFGQLAAVRALCRGGAYPTRPPNKAGHTPLTDAQRERHQHVVQFLENYSPSSTSETDDDGWVKVSSKDVIGPYGVLLQ